MAEALQTILSQINQEDMYRMYNFGYYKKHLSSDRCFFYAQNYLQRGEMAHGKNIE